MLDKSVFASKVWSFIVYLNETILINQSICIHFNIITDSIVPIRLLENSELSGENITNRTIIGTIALKNVVPGWKTGV